MVTLIDDTAVYSIYKHYISYIFGEVKMIYIYIYVYVYAYVYVYVCKHLKTKNYGSDKRMKIIDVF